MRGRREAERKRWLAIACLLVVAGTAGFLIGRMAAGDAVHEAQAGVVRSGGGEMRGREGEGRLLVLTTYFCSKPDFQRKSTVERNSYAYISSLYESVQGRDGVELVIFHDGQSQAFVDRWTTRQTRFVEVELRATIEMNDERFLFYEEFLASEEAPACDWVLMADVSDVAIVGDVVSHMEGLPGDCRLLVSQERQTAKAAQWLFGHPSPCYNKPKNFVNKHFDMRRRLYNAGMVAGEAGEVRRLLDGLVREFARMDHHDANCNMAVMQYVLQSEYQPQELCGNGACWEELCGDGPAVVAHKWPHA